MGNISTGDGHCVMIYGFRNGNFKIKDSHGVKYEIPLDRPDFIQVSYRKFHELLISENAYGPQNIFQGLLFKAVNNPGQAVTDPILIRNFPHPNNPNNLHPGILNLFQSSWNGTRLAQEFRYGIQ